MSIRNKLRILVVDDTATSRGLITQALESFGIANVATATDGKAALGVLSKSPVHLVISDYNMPEIDGLRLLHILRNTPQTRRIGFLLVTGRAEPAIIEKGKELGMNNYLPKPFRPVDLKAAIEAIVGRL